MATLGVNIDHVATLRQARGGVSPSVAEAATEAKKAGAEGITVHLREDRRHIQDADVRWIHENVKLPLNLEMSLNTDIVQFALDLKPAKVCLVPEKREERTTEGGLDILTDPARVQEIIEALSEKKIEVSLFLEPDERVLQMAAKLKVPVVELHTGAYAQAFSERKGEEKKELIRLHNASQAAHSLGLQVNAGHGLDYDNVISVLKIPHLAELNIGHAIICRALFIGLKPAVKEMADLIRRHSPS